MNSLWLNLRKRGANKIVVAMLQRFVVAHEIDVLLTQETASGGGPLAGVRMPGMRAAILGADLSIFVADRITCADVATLSEFAVSCCLDGVRYFNVHLSAYRSSERVRQIRDLQAAAEGEVPVVMGGDFNMAPRSCDGVYGGVESDWSSETERRVFEAMVNSCSLRDLLAIEGQQEFTIERIVRGKSLQFRCDLLLCSSVLMSRISASYLHTTRLGAQAFTDHSGISCRIGASPS